MMEPDRSEELGSLFEAIQASAITVAQTEEGPPLSNGNPHPLLQYFNERLLQMQLSLLMVIQIM